MKNVIIIFFALVACSNVFGQEAKANIKVGRHDQIISQTFLPNKGFILVTGIPNQIGGKLVFDVRYFNVTGEQVWAKPVTIKYSILKGTTHVVVSPNGETIYFVQVHSGGYYDKKHYISQFKINGDVKEFELEGKEGFGKSLQTIFCDDNYLYYLATDDGLERSNKKKGSEKLILNRFDEKDLAHQRIMLDLPAIESSEHTIYWSLIGQKGEEKFLASKSIDTDAGKNIFSIVAIDPQGKSGKVLKLETNLSEGKYTRPSFVPAENSWESPLVRMDYEIKQSTQTSVPTSQANSAPSMTTSTTTTRLMPTDGAFGHILYSDLHDCFYVYGLFGPKPFRNVGPVYEGFYIHKYNMNGSSLWKLQENASKELMDFGPFRVHSAPIERDIRILPVRENSIMTNINIRDSSFPYSVDSGGAAAAQPKREESNTLKTYYTTGRKLKSLAYIDKSNEGKKVEFICYQNSTNELLVKFDTKESTIEVLVFKD